MREYNQRLFNLVESQLELEKHRIWRRESDQGWTWLGANREDQSFNVDEEEE